MSVPFLDDERGAPSPTFSPDGMPDFGVFVVSIAEGRRNEIGISAMDVASTDVFVSQFCDQTQVRNGWLVLVLGSSLSGVQRLNHAPCCHHPERARGKGFS